MLQTNCTSDGITKDDLERSKSSNDMQPNTKNNNKANIEISTDDFKNELGECNIDTQLLENVSTAALQKRVKKQVDSEFQHNTEDGNFDHSDEISTDSMIKISKTEVTDLDHEVNAKQRNENNKSPSDIDSSISNGIELVEQHRIIETMAQDTLAVDIISSNDSNSEPNFPRDEISQDVLESVSPKTHPDISKCGEIMNIGIEHSGIQNKNQVNFENTQGRVSKHEKTEMDMTKDPISNETVESLNL